jgi:hypothetical protein
LKKLTHQAAHHVVAFGAILIALLSPALRASAGGVVSACNEASLRAALNGGSTVTFSSDCTILLSQQIVINEADTVIDAGGHNVVITSANTNGVPLFRVATNLTLRGLSLVNGGSTSAGGALYIQQSVDVIAIGCVFGANTAAGASGLAGENGTTNSANFGDDGGAGTAGVSGLGGAIYNLGNLTLANCTLTNNAAVGGVGGVGGNGGVGTGTFEVGGNGGNGGVGGHGQGGAVYNLGNLTLIDCSFSGNTAVGGAGGAAGTAGTGTTSGLAGAGGAGGDGAGGAVFNATNLTVWGSTFTTNSAIGGASATAGSNGNGSGKAGIKGAQGLGGAIYNGWWMVITNSTFYTNFVIGGAGGNGGPGGGTFALQGEGGDGGDGSGGSLYNANSVTNIVNCTFSSGGAFGGTNGVAGSGSFTTIDNGEIGAAHGGNIANKGPILVMMNSILSAAASGGNLFGSYTDHGNNLSSDSTGLMDLKNTNALLGPLAANGGFTLTMALLTNSPAIDRIEPAQAPPTDQRGVARPVNTKSDIGAFEFGASVTVSKVTLRIGKTSNGQVVVASGGAPGAAYLLQASTNISSGWQTISTNTALSTAPIRYFDAATSLSSRYYRIAR